jgi:hypothetical protein
MTPAPDPVDRTLNIARVIVWPGEIAPVPPDEALE